MEHAKNDAPGRPSPPIEAKSVHLTQEQVVTFVEFMHKLFADPGVQDWFRNIANGIRRLVEEIRPYAVAIGNVLNAVNELLARLPEQLQVLVLSLATRGWFFDHRATLALYWQLYELNRVGDVTGVDSLMARHFDARLDDIEADLCARLAHRAPKIRNALAAHRRGDFDLAIPALLAQADGVCKELRGGHFFLMDRATRRPETAAYVTANSSTVFHQVLHMALVEQIPLKHQMSKRGAADAGLLNRHAVMHGLHISDRPGHSFRSELDTQDGSTSTPCSAEVDSYASATWTMLGRRAGVMSSNSRPACS
jgi:hypothetical protein